MATWSELYEKVKIETEAAKKPFKEYKKERKTFTELFETCNAEKLNESKNTYSDLYEQYQKEMEPLTEQEAIYLVAKLDSGEKLTESELQKLEELGNPVKMNAWRGITNALGFKTKGNQAYAAARQAGKQMAKNNRQQQINAMANQKYGNALQQAQQQTNQLTAGNNQGIIKADGSINQGNIATDAIGGKNQAGAGNQGVQQQAQTGDSDIKSKTQKIEQFINNSQDENQKKEIQDALQKANGDIKQIDQIMQKYKIQ